MSSSSLRDLDDELMIREIALAVFQDFRERFGSFGYGLWSRPQNLREFRRDCGGAQPCAADGAAII